MSYLFLVCFLVGILLGVRILFFGAERRRLRSGTLPLRRSEPAIVSFLAMFGLVGYLLTRSDGHGAIQSVGISGAAGVLWGAIVTCLAIATARVTPEVDPDDPRFVLQGRVATVIDALSDSQLGLIRFDDGDAPRTMPARNIEPGVIPPGDEVCIERVDDGVASVERWAQVEKRL